ncbi:tRNA (adenosine(37)-N6)-dimethylallyltransferase MiaA [soil metagenome]
MQKSPRELLPKIVAVVGPTASGKTSLGEHLALTFGGEIVSVDAKQIYRGMDLGTAKEKTLKVPQHLIDTKNPGEVSTVAEYQAMAYACIDSLLVAGKLPVLVGGSMLYAEAVLNGYVFNQGEKSGVQVPRYASLKIGITWEREALKVCAGERLAQRIEAGLLAEIQGLLDQGVSVAWLMSCGMEYRYLTQQVLGELTAEEAFTKTHQSINQYIKRQYTWWRRHSDVHWVADSLEAERLVEQFLLN